MQTALHALKRIGMHCIQTRMHQRVRTRVRTRTHTHRRMPVRHKGRRRQQL